MDQWWLLAMAEDARQQLVRREVINRLRGNRMTRYDPKLFPPSEQRGVEFLNSLPDIKAGVISPRKMVTLMDRGFDTVNTVANANPMDLMMSQGVGVGTALRLIEAAQIKRQILAADAVEFFTPRPDESPASLWHRLFARGKRGITR
jgi:hypothetical protein